jgi:hypothetical protein
LETLKIINEYFPIRKSEYTYLASEYGHLEILKYLHNISIPINDQTIQTTLKNGHTHVAEYLVFIGHVTGCSESCGTDGMSDGIWKRTSINVCNLKKANIFDPNTLELNW